MGIKPNPSISSSTQRDVKSSITIAFIFFWLGIYLQRFVACQCEKKVHDVCRYYVKEKRRNGMDDVTRLYGSTRVPQTHTERIIVQMFPAHFYSATPT